jgi:hypothetical protein
MASAKARQQTASVPVRLRAAVERRCAISISGAPAPARRALFHL